jgi:hypothetical protein
MYRSALFAEKISLCGCLIIFRRKLFFSRDFYFNFATIFQKDFADSLTGLRLFAKNQTVKIKFSEVRIKNDRIHESKAD